MYPGNEDHQPVAFAGDLFLELAADGRLVLDAELADRVIADLERTIALVEAQLHRAEIAKALKITGVRALLPMSEHAIVDAAFVEQMAPGRRERGRAELLKYLEAIRRARRCPGSAGAEDQR